MTEADWLCCADPDAMLRFLKGRESGRKMRLFAAACCRRVWHRLTDPRSRTAIETAERFAEGHASDAQRAAAHREAKAAMLESDRGADGDTAWALRGELVALAAAEGVSAYLLTWLFNEQAQRQNPTGEAGEKGPQADLLRELFGPLPFRSVGIEPRWLTSDVTALARGTHEEQAYDGCRSWPTRSKRPGARTPTFWHTVADLTRTCAAAGW